MHRRNNSFHFKNLKFFFAIETRDQLVNNSKSDKTHNLMTELIKKVEFSHIVFQI